MSVTPPFVPGPSSSSSSSPTLYGSSLSSPHHPGKMFSIPTRMSSRQASIDAEKGNIGIFTPPMNTLPTVIPIAIPHPSLRRRRILGMAVSVMALMSIGGWWTGALPDLEGLLAGSNPPEVPVDPADSQNQPNNHPLHPLHSWGLDYPKDSLLAGLPPWPSKPPIDESKAPLSSLGHFADNLYNYGPTFLPDFAASLDIFADSYFPNEIAERLKLGLAVAIGGVEGETNWDSQKNVWQTDKNMGKETTIEVTSWKNGLATNEGWKWDLLTDLAADVWVRDNFGGSQIETLWNALPQGILRSDILRYLLLLVEGGIYSDTDTRLIRRPSLWGQGAKLWKNGEGWLKNADNVRILNGAKWEDVLGPPSVVVGIEADVGEREDWHDWYPRPMQIVQWTIASAPAHPIALSAILRIVHATNKAVSWAHWRAEKLVKLSEEGKMDELKALEETNVLSTKKSGGPVGVMDWTGPGVWTDAVLGYLNLKYGLVWTDLKNLREPLRIGDVVILPVTGFSPGVGQFGAEQPYHPQAMVEHMFAGSWKGEGNRRKRSLMDR